MAASILLGEACECPLTSCSAEKRRRRERTATFVLMISESYSGCLLGNFDVVLERLLRLCLLGGGVALAAPEAAEPFCCARNAKL